MSHPESYLDIVWGQFKKNRFAYAALWGLLPLSAVAVGAPLLASNQPLVFYDDGRTIFPWFRALLNPDEMVDYVFNVILLATLPWLPLAVVTNVVARRRGVPGRRRLGWVLGELAALSLLLAAVLAIPGVRPTNPYRTRTFAMEEFRSPEHKRGIYVLIPFGPAEQDLDAIFRPPGFRKDRSLWRESNDGFVHLLGTDNTGRDVLVQMIYGTRISMTVGFVAVGLYLSIGIVVGALAGYFGGWLDIGISRIIEIVLVFPAFFLILTLVALIGPSIYIIMIVIGVTGWPTIARLIRGEVLKQRALDYVTASRALGASQLRVLFRHVVPNSLSPALVAAPFGIASAIIVEAALSLLGFGVRPPAPSWGTLLKLGSANYTYWWLVVVPSLGIFLTVAIFNLVGSGLRDALDPRLRM